MVKKISSSLKLNPGTKDYLIQAVLIFASVFFAFYLNDLSEDNRKAKQKQIALSSILNELYRNSAIVEDWHKKHNQVYHNINSILEGKRDSLKTELLSHKYLKLSVLTNNESLIDAILTNTAWETAKSTGIISEFDFETTQDLTYVYSMQQILMDKTMQRIMDFYFDMKAHEMENIDAILIQFQLRFGELTGQEYLLKQLYKDAIKSVE